MSLVKNDVETMVICDGVKSSRYFLNDEWTFKTLLSPMKILTFFILSEIHFLMIVNHFVVSSNDNGLQQMVVQALFSNQLNINCDQTSNSVFLIFCLMVNSVIFLLSPQMYSHSASSEPCYSLEGNWTFLQNNTHFLNSFHIKGKKLKNKKDTNTGLLSHFLELFFFRIWYFCAL